MIGILSSPKPNPAIGRNPNLNLHVVNATGEVFFFNPRYTTYHIPYVPRKYLCAKSCNSKPMTDPWGDCTYIYIPNMNGLHFHGFHVGKYTSSSHGSESFRKSFPVTSFNRNHHETKTMRVWVGEFADRLQAVYRTRNGMWCFTFGVLKCVGKTTTKCPNNDKVYIIWDLPKWFSGSTLFCITRRILMILNK